MYLGTKPSNPATISGDSAVIGGDDLAQILGIEAHGEPSQVDQIAEHHRQLPAFGSRCSGSSLRCSIDIAEQCGDRLEQLAAVADRGHAKADQVIGRQLRQHLGIDIVVAESGLVSLEAQVAQPRR
jgi:hypothetical protein